MTNPKITRKDSEEHWFKALETLMDTAAYLASKDILETVSILRQCRIIEPGGLDAETYRKAADDADMYYHGCVPSCVLRDRADAIEKGE